MPRPKGSENRITTEVKEALHEAIAGEIEKLPKHLGQLEPAERVEALSKLIGYIIPKLRSSDTSVSVDGPLMASKPSWFDDK
jgi:hypothetical protein